MESLFRHITGVYGVDNNGAELIYQFKDISEFLDDALFNKFLVSYDLKEANKNGIFNAVSKMTKADLRMYRESNLKLTKASMKGSLTEDDHIIHAVSMINDLNRIFNILVKRLRNWQSLNIPELDYYVRDHERYLEILNLSHKEIMRKLKIDDSIGSEFSKEESEEISRIAKEARSLLRLNKNLSTYLESIMKRTAPNIQALLGTTIGANIILLAGSLRKLAMLPSSTAQLLGAEKALFRHITTGAKSPKYGIIHEHYLITRSKEKGKTARALAEKIILAARLDFFKGEFKGPAMLDELEKRFDIKK